MPILPWTEVLTLKPRKIDIAPYFMFVHFFSPYEVGLGTYSYSI